MLVLKKGMTFFFKKHSVHILKKGQKLQRSAVMYVYPL